MYLETERCRVRPLRQEDAGALGKILADPCVMRFLEPPFSQEQTARFVAQCLQASPPPIHTVLLRGEEKAAGYLIFHPYRGRDWELGWVLGRELWGRGLAGELTRAVSARARREGIPALVLECVPEQAATRRLAEKHGFRLQGREGDLLVYRLPLAGKESS